MQNRSVVSVVLLVAVTILAAFLFWPMNVPEVEQVQTMTTPGPATRTPDLVTLPADRPTPHRFADGDDVLQYVHDVVDPYMVWEEYYVARARMSDIHLMFYGPGASYKTPEADETPTGFDPSSPRGRAVVWIVGVRSLTPITPDRLDKAQFFYWPGKRYSHPGGTEAYFVVDDIGNISESGFLDSVDDQGTPTHYAPWSLSDIESLPSP